MAYQPLPAPSLVNGKIEFTVPGTAAGTLSVRRVAAAPNPAGNPASAAVPQAGTSGPTISNFSATATGTANQLRLVATINPANTSVEASTDNGATWRAVAMSTVGSQQEGVLTGVAAGTYAAGTIKLRAVAFPAVVVSEPLARTVPAAASTAAYVVLFEGTSRVADERPRAMGGGNTLYSGTPVSDYNNPWPLRLKTAYAGNTAYEGWGNYATFGDDISAGGMLHDAELTEIGNALVPGKRNILFLHHWINNVHGLVINQPGLTVQQTTDQVVQVINDHAVAVKARATAKAAELVLILFTEPSTMPAGYASLHAKMEQVVSAVRTYLRTNYQAMGFLVLVDLYSDPSFGGLNVPASSARFLSEQSGTHFVHYSGVAGHQFIADTFAAPALAKAVAGTAGIVEVVTVAPAPTLDKTRFLVFYESKTAGNTVAQWQDVSGKGRHATRLAGDTGVALLADATGRQVYRHAAGNQSWRVPALAPTAGDYTIYAYVRVTTPSPTYFFDVTTERTLVAMNSPDGYIYSGSFTGQGTPADVTGLHRATWQLNSGANAAAFLLDNVAQRTGGAYVARALTSPGRLGSSEDGGAQVFVGDIIAFAVAAGNDTAAQRSAVDTYFASL